MVFIGLIEARVHVVDVCALGRRIAEVLGAVLVPVLDEEVLLPLLRRDAHRDVVGAPRELVDDRVLQRALDLRKRRIEHVPGEGDRLHPSCECLQEGVYPDAACLGHDRVWADHVRLVERRHMAARIGVEVYVVEIREAIEVVPEFVGGDHKACIRGQDDRIVRNEDVQAAPRAGGATLVGATGGVRRVEVDDRVVVGGRDAFLDHQAVQMSEPNAVGVATVGLGTLEVAVVRLGVVHDVMVPRLRAVDAVVRVLGRAADVIYPGDAVAQMPELVRPAAHLAILGAVVVRVVAHGQETVALGRVEGVTARKERCALVAGEREAGIDWNVHHDAVHTRTQAIACSEGSGLVDSATAVELVLVGVTDGQRLPLAIVWCGVSLLSGREDLQAADAYRVGVAERADDILAGVGADAAQVRDARIAGRSGLRNAADDRCAGLDCVVVAGAAVGNPVEDMVALQRPADVGAVALDAEVPVGVLPVVVGDAVSIGLVKEEGEPSLSEVDRGSLATLNVVLDARVVGGAAAGSARVDAGVAPALREAVGAVVAGREGPARGEEVGGLGVEVHRVVPVYTVGIVTRSGR